MPHAFATVVFLSALTVSPPVPAAETVPPASQSAAQLGSLQRTAASLDGALDIYRLALVELVPAFRRVLEAGHAAGALPTSPVPPPAAEVFTRLARSVARRTPMASMPALARAYHAEVLDALDALADANSLAQVLPPARVLTASLGRICGLAENVVDLFSRERPILTEVLNPSTALDDINEALEQLGLAEANISAVHTRRGAPGEQLQAFLRLEMALGHALDLIAAAEESGVHIGFEMPLSTVGFARRLTAVRKHLDSLAGVVKDMAREPRGVGQDLSIELTEVARGAEARLAWTPPAPGSSAPALLRLYRRTNVAAVAQSLRDGLRCEGRDPTEAEKTAAQAVRPVSDAPVPMADLPPGRGSFADSFAEMPLAPPMYRLVSVTAFGIESKGVEHAPLAVPHALAPARFITASVGVPNPESPLFYRDADAVLVRWQGSANDVRGNPTAWQFAARTGAPVVAHYDVYRTQGDVAVAVARVPAGLAEFVDRPAPAVLQAGVSYTVAAVDEMGHAAHAPDACAKSAVVRLDLDPALTLARAGAAFVSRPTLRERQLEETLRDPNRLALARAAFEARPSAERETLTRGWWQDTAVGLRRAWLQHWPNFMTEQERSAWLTVGPQHLQGRDWPWAKAEVWLALHPELAGEVERWWGLLDTAARAAALTTWHGHLNRVHATWLAARVKGGDLERGTLERPARVLAWWLSRDTEEQERMTAWWDGLAPSVRQERLEAWFNALPPEARLAVRWPDWEQQDNATHEALLLQGYQDLPSGLWPTLLAWVTWQELDTPTKADAIAAEVGVWKVTWSKLRYAIRPLDRWLDFNLAVAIAIVLVGALFGLLLQFGVQRPETE